MSEPRTKAGKALLVAINDCHAPTFAEAERLILAIEAEAASPAAGEGLDVEWLAEAFYEITRARFAKALVPLDLPAWPDVDPKAKAKAIEDGAEVAAEYARLTATEAE